MARILVVDDEPDILMVVRLSLEAHGHEVLLAADGRMALDRLTGHLPDLVLLDLMMPVLDGWGVLVALRDRPEEVPVVVLSALVGNKAAERRAYDLGALDVVGKPFEVDALLRRVDELLALDAVGRCRRRDRRRVECGIDDD
ncbi:MAG TPA: response regulator [Acidimicrobiales bacterium]|nr:response regulator [Acidimicrobiales bacterium]